MTNFIFKSASRLTKNSPISNANLDRKLIFIQEQLRWLRSDNDTIQRKLDRLLIDKHLQMQVDDFYKEDQHDLNDK